MSTSLGIGLLLVLCLAGCAAGPEPSGFDPAEHWDFSDPASSQARFAALLYDAAGDERLEILTQIARAKGLAGDFAGARAVLAEVAEQLETAAARARIRYELESGRVENSSGDPAASVVHFEQALELAQQAGEDGLVVDAAHMLGIVLSGDDAIAWTKRALAVAETSPDPTARRWRSALYNNLGWAEFDAGRAEAALRHFERALELRLEEGEQESIWIARWSVARTLRELGRGPEARVIQTAIQRERELAGSPDPYVDEELALLRADA